jgi:hypothetical protein
MISEAYAKISWFLGIFLNLKAFSHGWSILYGLGSSFLLSLLKKIFFPFPNKPFLPIRISFMHDGKRIQIQLLF